MISCSFKSLLFVYLLWFFFINTSYASEACEGAGIITSVIQINGANAAKIEDVNDECAAYKLGLKAGDIIVKINGNAPDVENVNAILGYVIASYPEYSIDIETNDGAHKTISNPVAISNENTILLEERFIEPTQAAENEVFNEAQQNFPTEAPIYPNSVKIGGDWTNWIKWFIFFLLLTLSLTPAVFMFFTGGKQVAYFFGAAAFLGAAKAKGNPYKGALDSMQFYAVISLVALFLGPFGVLYCIYHPITAALSESDKTYCCAMTWLGGTDIAKKAISPDGRWLAEIKETSHSYLGLGDKELAQDYALSVMDLANGKHIKWPQTGQKLLGVDNTSQTKAIAIDDGIYVQPVSYISNTENWFPVDTEYNLTRPINADRIAKVHSQYALYNSDIKNQEVSLQDLSSGDILTIQPELAFDAHYLSYNGRVLALVKAQERANHTDGLIKQLAKMLLNYVSESWTIEFWDVRTGKKIKAYSGHGVSEYSWKHDDIAKLRGQTKFLESSQDGMLWYMIKSDGYIHVFDMRKHMV